MRPITHRPSEGVYSPPPMPASVPRPLLDAPTMAFHVGELESRTSAEVVVACVERSDGWREARWIGGVCGMMAGLAVSLALPWRLSDEALVVFTLAGFAAGWRLARRLPGLERRLVPRSDLARRVELCARAAFQKGELHRTRDATALLVFLSLHERCAALVADRSVRLALLGDDLERGLPRAASDVDELPATLEVSL